MEKDIPCKINHTKAGLVILTPDKLDFKTRTVPRDKEGHLKITKKIHSLGRHNNPKYIFT